MIPNQLQLVFDCVYAFDLQYFKILTRRTVFPKPEILKLLKNNQYNHTWAWGGLGGGTGPPPGRKFNVWGDWSPPDRDLIACRYRKLVPPQKVAHAHV